MKDNKQFVWCVNAYYDMNIDKDEEIVNEVYATEELAKERTKQLIKKYKDNFNNGQTYSDCWEEDEFHLYAYMDSEWNVDIFYVQKPVFTTINGKQTNKNEEDMTITLNFHIYEGVDGKTWFTERYQDKESAVALWRYGYKISEDAPWTAVKSGLLSKPNLKRMGLIK